MLILQHMNLSRSMKQVVMYEDNLDISMESDEDIRKYNQILMTAQ